MDSGSYIVYLIVALFCSLVIGFMLYLVFSRVSTVPFKTPGHWSEGFQGPSQGVSDIPCGQESAEAVALSEMFVGRSSTTEEGKPDLKELKLILSKLTCIKHDLVGTAQVVQSTLYLPYSNTHDRENPADTVARCFTKSIPPRDLDISFGTWKQRGEELINRLCTSYKFSKNNSEYARGLFRSVWTDTFSVAKNACSPPAKAAESESPRNVTGFTPETVKELGPYSGYY